MLIICKILNLTDLCLNRPTEYMLYVCLGWKKYYTMKCKNKAISCTKIETINFCWISISENLLYFKHASKEYLNAYKVLYFLGILKFLFL